MTASRLQGAPRFGVWAPVYGAWGSHQHPDDPFDAGYARTRDLARQAERLGLDSMLIAEHLINPHDHAIPGRGRLPVLETWSTAAGVAEATERLEIIAAVKPLLFHPGVLAKLAAGIQEISAGRFALNIVSGWYLPEFERLGIDAPPHDQRYALTREWLTVVQELLAGGPVRHHGERFAIDDFELVPSPPPPTIYFGGESEAAKRLAGDAADVFFINGRPVEQVAALVAELRARPRDGAPLRFALTGFVITRPTDAEAEDEHRTLLELASRDDLSGVLASADPEQQMRKVLGDRPRVGTNGGTLAGLVGSYDTVARQIERFLDAGIEHFMLQFQPLEAELERFAAEIIPRVARDRGLAGVRGRVR